jgi:hypothetical protein
MNLGHGKPSFVQSSSGAKFPTADHCKQKLQYLNVTPRVVDILSPSI